MKTDTLDFISECHLFEKKLDQIIDTLNELSTHLKSKHQQLDFYVRLLALAAGLNSAITLTLIFK